jgi:antitoxin VapB
MAGSGIAKIFQNGRSQAVRLPREFRLKGDRVRVRRVAEGVLLQPMFPDTKSWFDELDRLSFEKFMSGGRNQPITPQREIFK